MEQIKIDVVKQWLINKKEFSTLEVIKTLEKENAEQKAQIEQLSNDNHVLKTSFITQQEQIEKMKNDQKTAFIKGVRHFAKAMKKYDQTEGAWTDYFEHTVDTVLKRELAK